MFLVSWFVWDLSFGCLAAGVLLHYLFGGWFGVCALLVGFLVLVFVDYLWCLWFSCLCVVVCL